MDRERHPGVETPRGACVLRAGDDAGRPQGGQQAVVGLDQHRQTGIGGYICHSCAGRQGSGRTSGTGRAGRPGRTSRASCAGRTGRTSGTSRAGRAGGASGAGCAGRTGGTSGAGCAGRAGRTSRASCAGGALRPHGAHGPGGAGHAGGASGAGGSGNGTDPYSLAGRRTGGTGTIGIQRLGGNGAARAAETFLMIHKHNLHSQDMRSPGGRCGREWFLNGGLKKP